MRKHVAPADPRATIPDPTRGRDLPPDGHEVDWSPYWAGLAMRGDVIVSELAPVADAGQAPEHPPGQADGQAPAPDVPRFTGRKVRDAATEPDSAPSA